MRKNVLPYFSICLDWYYRLSAPLLLNKGYFVSELTKLLEQTTFLLEKQRESRDYTVMAFNDFLREIETIQQERDDQTEHDTLQEIYNAVTEQSEKYTAEIDEDISFLDAQLETIQKIAGEGNNAKAIELVRVLMDGEEVPDTESFQQEVNEETDSAKRHFFAVIDDLKSALKEESFDELLTYIEQSGAFEGEEEEGASCCGGANEACCGDAAAPERTKCCEGKSDCGDACVCDDNCGCA